MEKGSFILRVAHYLMRDPYDIFLHPNEYRLAVIVVGQNSVTEQKIAEQIQTLNSFYGPYNINFVLVK